MSVIKHEIKEISVNADFECSSKNRLRKITPLSFQIPNGPQYTIEKVRRSYSDRVGNAYNIHFVVKTTNERYFDILYDSKKLMWFLVLEIEDILIFND
jgi:hypothetical protein